MALIRALEESLRDLTWLYFSLLVLPATYSYLPTSTCSYLLLPTPTYFYLLLPLPTSGLLMATPRGLPLPTSGLLMATPRGLPTRESLGCQGHCWDAAGRSYQITSESGHTIHRLIFTDFYRFFGLSWEPSTIIVVIVIVVIVNSGHVNSGR